MSAGDADHAPVNATQTAPQTAPQPPRRRRRRVPLAPREIHVRKQGFWASRWGVAVTVVMSLSLVALLVGWILLWVFREETSVALLVLGIVGFSLNLVFMVVLQNRLMRHAALRQAEAVFLSGVSHNLRTPIAAIRAAAQALERPDLEEAHRVRLRAAIVHQTRRMGLRVDNVLETGRIEVERRPFEKSAVDFTALLEERLSEARALIHAKGGGIDVEVADDVVVRGDDRALRLLLDNLLDNALKYADGPPLLRVSLQINEAFAHLRVVDTGLGFEPAQAEHIFERFQQGDHGRGGVGLGLPLSRAIARAHGGELRLSSAGRGTGATADLYVPLREEG